MAKAKKHIHNSQNVVWVILAVVILILISAFLTGKSDTQIQEKKARSQPITSLSHQVYPFNFGNQKITVDNQLLNFVNGSYKNSSATGEVSANIANQAFNSDRSRGAAILVYNPGGSGTFYYLVGAMKQGDNDIYSTPVLLGDRIKIVSVIVDNPGAEDNGVITVQYLDRAADASMATDPTQPMIKKYAFEEDGNLTEVLH